LIRPNGPHYRPAGFLIEVSIFTKNIVDFKFDLQFPALIK
jgi:hypothetical protein